ncbi:hypothetical protein P280DRAFT_472733 [Massarina eburnea CBS 473.64]|uniref:Uncharacterized protein n=1 Tax=Massarina eburnea CBS 473.64 TaxID=1395130 RepID=A0A6A6RRI3_9PLEO|nr:hypothetical protein P280DRAFT_472733 [Massarina eburnea CBS 473.64]
MADASNKRHAMIFRRRSPSKTPSIDEGLPLNHANFPNGPRPLPPQHQHQLGTPKMHSQAAAQSRQPLTRTQSSEYFLEIQRHPAAKSRKMDFNKVIRTDATDTQPAFESDAFAVQMPTTREPVMDTPVYRAKIPKVMHSSTSSTHATMSAASPSRAQAEAYQTYKEKARLVRARNNSEGVRVPSKIVSYDYAYATRDGVPALSPAGSFPISPPIPQHSWLRSTQVSRNPSLVPQAQVKGPRSIGESSNISLARKPLGLGNTSATPTPTAAAAQSRFQRRGDTDGGAVRSTPSPSPSPPKKIAVRLRPKEGVNSSTELEDKPQKESWWGLYNRSNNSSTTTSNDSGSRAPSPSKSGLNFAYTTAAAVAPGDAVFGYTNTNITGTQAATARSVLETRKKEREREQSEKEKHTTGKGGKPSRWAWLRPTGPRIGKPIGPSPTSTANTAKAAAYMDPFILHASPVPTLTAPTPNPSRPASPKKIVRSAPAVQPGTKFESGFSQITSVGSLVLKVCIFVYALVGLYYLLDAIREAIHVLGAPLRIMKIVLGYMWVWSVVLAKVLNKGWEKWGIKIAFKGGWRKWW